MTPRAKGAPAAVAAVLVAVLLLGMPFLAGVASAEGTAAAYVTAPQSISFQLSIPVHDAPVTVPAATTDANGNTVPGTQTIQLSIPAGITPDAVIVRIEQATGAAKLVALDAAGTAIASYDVVPLSTGYTATLPGNTATITIENYDLNESWSGTVVVEVVQLVSFTLVSAPTKIIVPVGQTVTETFVFKQDSGPAGRFYLQGYDPIGITVISEDPTPETASDMYIETTGAGWQGDVLVKVTVQAGTPAGTYNIQVKGYFQDSSGSLPNPVEFDAFKITMSVDTAGTATGDVQTDDEGIDMKLVLAGAAILLLAIIILRNKGGA